MFTQTVEIETKQTGLCQRKVTKEIFQKLECQILENAIPTDKQNEENIELHSGALLICNDHYRHQTAVIGSVIIMMRNPLDKCCIR